MTTKRLLLIVPILIYCSYILFATTQGISNAYLFAIFPVVFGLLSIHYGYKYDLSTILILSISLGSLILVLYYDNSNFFVYGTIYAGISFIAQMIGLTFKKEV